MAKSLVIVESPAKAKTINAYLGPDFIVDASLGHVKDLPKGGLSIDIEGGFVPTYETIRGKEDVLARLRNLASRCERVFLATDPDREGEAIANHIAEEIGEKNRNIRRVIFNEITKSAITAAIRKPRDIDRPMVEAQEARRVMDRLIGYKVSPFLWNTFRGESRGLSAGRVQSVALRLVVERERAINSFIPIEYWSLNGTFRTRRGDEIQARLLRYDGIEIRNPTGSAADLKESKERPAFISTKEEAERIRERALREQYAIESIARKEVKRNAPPPFTTSTLQQAAGRRLRMSSKHAMQVAQKLYEGAELGNRGRVGLITYMRTDSIRISDEAAQMAEEFIYENYGKDYLPPKRKEFKQKGKNVQDAHEAIRPTDLKITPKEARKHLDGEMAALYELIWNRFVASQMAAAIIDQTTVDILGGPFLFRATGRITRFRGWMQVYGDDEEGGEKGEGGKEKGEGRREKGERKKGKGDAESSDGSEGNDQDGDSDRPLPEYIVEGESLTLEKIEPKQSFTKPPPRYTESLLVKEMEAKGIGRPSTYASIISTIQERGYVEQRERKLYATELGMKVCDALVAQFPALFDVKFTAKMEGDLDTIASGKTTYLKVMQGFYGPFQRSLGSLRLPGAQGGGAKDIVTKRLPSGEERKRVTAKGGEKTDAKCGKCGAPMVLRQGNYGPYLACTAFPACRNIVNATADGTPKPRTTGVSATGEQASGAAAKRSKTRASKSDGGGASVQRRAAPPAGREENIEPCRECGSPMVRRKGKSGEFFGCSNYPACRGTRPIPLGVKCPLCHEGDIVERVGGQYSSIFYGCNRYPDCRFTSSHRPVATPCKRCGNAWMATIDSPVEGKFLECQKCRGRR